MVTITIPTPARTNVIAGDVSYEDYINGFEGQRVEWVQGDVIEMPGVDERHDAVIRFLDNLFEIYLELSDGGRVLQDPVLMRVLPTVVRAPDLQVLLPSSMDRLKRKQVEGAADLVVEVVSPGSERVDRVAKFAEYEQGGVPEYWVVDWTYREALFLVRNQDGVYERKAPDADGIYHSVVLPKLRLEVNLLWRETLPGIRETLALVESWFADA